MEVENLKTAEEFHTTRASVTEPKLHILVHQRILNIMRSIVSLIPMWAWLLPAIGVTVIIGTSGPLLPWFVGKYAFTGKDCQEVVGPVILLAAATLALYRYFVHTSTFDLWLISLPAVLFCREIHFRGTSVGVYVGLALIVLQACRHPEIRHLLLVSPGLRGWWFGAATIYALALSLDAGVWKFLPYATWWGVNLEETLESIGHLLILLGVLSANLVAQHRRICHHSLLTRQLIYSS